LEITYYDEDHRLIAKEEKENRLMAKREKGKIYLHEKERYDPIYGWILRAIYNIHCRRLISHTSEKTFFVDSEGCIIKEPSAAELEFNTTS
jgi:hypothetical protein